MNNALLTIVIPTYNSEKYLEECLSSLADQWDNRIELIVVDAASKDATLDICSKFKNVISRLISEPDKGQSDAFNKGFQIAKGKYLTWLNSDDIIIPGAISLTLAALETVDGDWFACNSAYLDAGGHFIKCFSAGGFENFALRFGVLNVLGPSTIFSKDIYLKSGPMSLDYHYCMDTEYWWRLATSGIRFRRFNHYFWGLRLHDDAKTASVIMYGKHPPRMQQESHAIQKKYFPEVSTRCRWWGIQLIRAYRVLTFSYFQGAFDTLRYKGKKATLSTIYPATPAQLPNKILP